MTILARAALCLAVLFAVRTAEAVDFDKGEVTVETADGKRYLFHVEVAVTPEQQAQGLMFRKSMAADAGMIFVNKPPRATAFWMHNTLIPLDMLFVATNGRIMRIKQDATPMSDAEIPSGGIAAAVVELNGGTVARLGIKLGDRVVFPGLGG